MVETPEVGSRCGVGGFTRDDGIGIRFWRPGDTPALNAFYNNPAIRPAAGHKSAEARTDRQWEWEFALGGRVTPAYAVAEKGGRIVGTQAYIPIPMCVDGRTVMSGKDEDTLVHPDHRGRGVLDDLYRLVLERARLDRIAMLWGFTNSAVRPLLRNGFESIGTFDAMAMALTTVPDVRSNRAEQTSLRIDAMSRADDRMDGFAVRFAESTPGLGLNLTAAFLRWRVFENPFREYTILAATVESELVGIGLFKYEQRRGCGYVSELAAVDAGLVNRSEIQRALLTEGLRCFRERGLACAEARPSGGHGYNRELRMVLSHVGFKDVAVTNPLEFLVRPVMELNPSALEGANWRICELMREY